MDSALQLVARADYCLRRGRIIFARKGVFSFVSPLVQLIQHQASLYYSVAVANVSGHAARKQFHYSIKVKTLPLRWTPRSSSPYASELSR